MKRQTAVEFLIKEFNLKDYEATIKLAKSIEKEQIIDAFEEGENNSIDYFVPENRITESEQYYNETFEL